VSVGFLVERGSRSERKGLSRRDILSTKTCSYSKAINLKSIHAGILRTVSCESNFLQVLEMSESHCCDCCVEFAEVDSPQALLLLTKSKYYCAGRC
jgi:hypothetical protein